MERAPSTADLADAKALVQSDYAIQLVEVSRYLKIPVTYWLEDEITDKVLLWQICEGLVLRHSAYVRESKIKADEAAEKKQQLDNQVENSRKTGRGLTPQELGLVG